MNVEPPRKANNKTAEFVASYPANISWSLSLNLLHRGHRLDLQPHLSLHIHFVFPFHHFHKICCYKWVPCLSACGSIRGSKVASIDLGVCICCSFHWFLLHLVVSISCFSLWSFSLPLSFCSPSPFAWFLAHGSWLFLGSNVASIVLGGWICCWLIRSHFFYQ